MSLPWSTRPFGEALRDALEARGMSYRDLESRSLVPVGNLHDHVSGKRGVPGDDLLRRIAEGVRVEPAYFREWRHRRLVEAFERHPDVELRLWRRLERGGFATVPGARAPSAVAGEAVSPASGPSPSPGDR